MIEVFKALMSIFVILVVLNIILSILLWKTTRSRVFLILTLHWLMELGTFYIGGAMAQESPAMRLLAPQLTAFFGVYTLSLILGRTLGIEMPLKKFIAIPFISMMLIYPLDRLGLSPAIVAIPLEIACSFCFFFISYKAIRYHRSRLTASMWMIIVVYILYGIHFFDFGYFFTRFDLLVVGFTISLIFHIATSMLIPAMLIEEVAKEKAKLEAEMLYKARLINTSKMIALVEMAGGMAHEINTPLATIELVSDQVHSVLDEEPIDKSRIQNYMTTIQETTARIAKIIQGLKAFSKDASQDKMKTVSVKAVIDNTLDLCRERFKHNGIVVKCESISENLAFEVREIEISQVLLNLLTNSHDSIENLSSKWIDISALEKNNFIEIRVTDSGNGIPAEIREKIFQPFYTTKDIGKGTGLGLSLAHGIIQAHKGTITIDTENAHTCFVISLPQRQ